MPAGPVGDIKSKLTAVAFPGFIPSSASSRGLFCRALLKCWLSRSEMKSWESSRAPQAGRKSKGGQGWGLGYSGNSGIPRQELLGALLRI